MFGAFRKLKTKPKTSAELHEALQVIWGNLTQGLIDKAVKNFSNKATGGWCCSLELAEDTSNIQIRGTVEQRHECNRQTGRQRHGVSE